MSSPAKRPPLPRNVQLLGWASMLQDVASEMIFPLLPALMQSLTGSSVVIGLYLGLMEGTADAIASVLKLWSGGWSDRVGQRKQFVVFGYSLPALARPLMGLAVAPWQLLAIRIGDRIGKGIRTAPRDALIAESTAPEERGWAFGFHRGMDHVGAMLGPLFAFVFLYFWPGELRVLCWLTIVPGLLVLALVIFGLREEPRAKVEAAQKFQFSLRPFDGNFRLYLLSLTIFTLGNSSDAFLLLRAGELGVDKTLLPILWFALHVVKSSGAMLVGRWLNVLGLRRSIVAGWLIYGLVYLAFGFATEAWQVWVLFLVYGLFYALTEPAEKTLVASLVSGEKKGLAYGWYNFAIGIAALPASLIFGILDDSFGALAAFGFGAAMAAVAMVLLARVNVPK
jgi:MFS family permease